MTELGTLPSKTDTIISDLPEIATTLDIPEITELMPAMQQTIAELKIALENGEYGILIGDDRSGRIPASIIRDIINHINNHQERPPIPTIFVQSNYGGLEAPEARRLTRRLQTLSQLVDKPKALLVSEFINTGDHVRAIADVVHQAGMHCDVVGLRRVAHDTDYQEDGPEGFLRPGERLFPTPGYSADRPQIYKNTLTGLRRNSITHFVRGARAATKHAVNQIIAAQHL